jgi:ABC-type phosphate transport system, permease component
MYLCAGITCALLALLIGYLLRRGVGHLTWALVSGQSSYLKNTIGILPNILNTLYIILVAMAFRILDNLKCSPEDIATVVTAIGNHDEGTGVPVNAVAAALILADKSDVRRSRVRSKDTLHFDIHDRVNYSVTKSLLKINEEHTLIKLKLSVDTKYGSVMDYFEIFMDRMVLCRKAAEKLGMQFKLMINEQQLI